MGRSADVLSVREAATRLGLSREAVQKLVASGRLPATKRAGAWWIDAGAVERRLRQQPGTGRPLSSAVAWSVLLQASGEADTSAWRALSTHANVHPRATNWLHSHALATNPAALRNRGKREQLDGHPSEFSLILAHENVRATGISAASEIGLHGGPEECELYAPISSRRVLLAEHALVPAADGSVLARWVPDEIWPAIAAAERIPTAAVLLDLLEHDDPRARRAAAAALAR